MHGMVGLAYIDIFNFRAYACLACLLVIGIENFLQAGMG
jgi:hypothetical protein